MVGNEQDIFFKEPSPTIARWRYRMASRGLPLLSNEWRLTALHNRFIGRRIFVLGNGPSLLNTAVDKLCEEITIASNAIFLLFDQTAFRPTFYTIEDRVVAEDRCRDINTLYGMTRIYPLDLFKFFGRRRDTIYVNFIRKYRPFPLFSTNFMGHVYWGGTVTFLNLQLAHFLGAKEVFLIGVDHSYQPPDPSDKVNGPVILSQSQDVNHFHPNYFGPGYRWHDPKVERMEAGYRVARDAFESNGRRIINATAGGKLEVFPRVDFDSLF